MRVNSRAVKLVSIVTIAFSAAAFMLALPLVAKVAGESKASEPKVSANKARSSQSKNAGGNKADASRRPGAAPAEAKGGNAEAEAGNAGTRNGETEPAPGKEGDHVEAEPDVWSEDQIAEAKAYCDKILKGVEAVIEPAESLKEGQCGAPAPVRLISVGRNPEVVLSPPVTVTCDMVVKLADWIKHDVQDLARTHLGGPIVRIGTMSSYSCRNAYGRKKTRLSEHGRANAVDLGSFTTSNGQKVDLLSGWGMTARDIQAIVAAAKAAAEKAEANKAKTDKAAAARVASKSGKKSGTGKATSEEVGDGTSGSRGPASTGGFETRVVAAAPEPPIMQAGVVAMTTSKDRKSRGNAARHDLEALTVASHLGGPTGDPDSLAALDLKPHDSRSQFLRAAHRAACRRFGTVLGPEANEAHRNHFHLDMAERKRGNYCE